MKEVWLPENVTAVRAGVFAKLTALEDIHLPNSNVTLFDGALPDHKVTIHVPCDVACRKTLSAYDWYAGMLMIMLVLVLIPFSGMYRRAKHS